VRLVIPAMVVAEASYLVGSRLGPAVEAAFLGSLVELDVEAPLLDDWKRIAELVEQYADFPLGGTDASVIALAERLRTDLVITLDRRHFGAIRPTHCPALRLLP
jgi:predicted nucleic acid-binding protein